MARKNPLGKIKDAAVETIKDPVGTGQKAVGQAVGQALGTLGTVTSTVGAVTSKVPGRRRSSAKSKSQSQSQSRPRPVAVPDAPSRPHGDPVTPTKAPTKTPVKKATKNVGGAVPTPAEVATKPAVKSTASKTSATKMPAKKTPAKKTPAKKTPAKKTPAKKTPAKKTPALQGARKRPLTAAELAAGAGTDVLTPVGTRGADVAFNPDTNITDLQQPGTEPLVDPSTTKAVAKEADILRRAADPHKG